MTCEDIVLESLAENAFPIKGNILYHDLSSMGYQAPRINTEESPLVVELIQNPNSNFRGSGKTMKMIHVSLPSELYEGSIIARGGDEMIDKYNQFCQKIENGEYSLHLFSNSSFQISD